MSPTQKPYSKGRGPIGEGVRLAALLSVAEMYAADRAAVAVGVDGPQLMAQAGAGIAREIGRRWPARPGAVATVLCGPGNNGGDGFVVAAHLADAGWRVRLALLGTAKALKGDAALYAGRWQAAGGAIASLTAAALPGLLKGSDVLVDALFGAGLSRPLAGDALAAVAALNRAAARGVPVVAVDMPSGIDGDSGAVLAGDGGQAVQARLTVTFFRKKPGHLLLPGRAHCGEVVCVDIGTPAAVLDEIAPACFENGPLLWLDVYPWPRPDGHKYSRGHGVVVGGREMTGAGRLAARAAMRTGAGLVTVAAAPEVLAEYRAGMAGLLTLPLSATGGLGDILKDPRRNGVLLGPGNGLGMATRRHVLTALESGRACVLDADALTVFGDDPDSLFAGLSPSTILTPHDGEFNSIFKCKEYLSHNKLERVRHAARRAGAVVLLKGADTVIAAPDGRATITANGPPTLATAGAGDVLAGMCLGLVVQGMPAFEAAAAAAWLHGEAARAFGPGLVAEDLPDGLPPQLARLARMVGV